MYLHRRLHSAGQRLVDDGLPPDCTRVSLMFFRTRLGGAGGAGGAGGVGGPGGARFIRVCLAVVAENGRHPALFVPAELIAILKASKKEERDMNV